MIETIRTTILSVIKIIEDQEPMDLETETVKNKSISNTMDRVISKMYKTDQRQDDMEPVDAELHRICRECAEACLRTIVEHLYRFLDEHGYDADPGYEDWIKKLHPENITGTQVDHRFYIEESEHRLVWNELMELKGREGLLVHPRTLRRLRTSREQPEPSKKRI